MPSLLVYSFLAAPCCARVMAFAPPSAGHCFSRSGPSATPVSIGRFLLLLPRSSASSSSSLKSPSPSSSSALRIFGFDSSSPPWWSTFAAFTPSPEEESSGGGRDRPNGGRRRIMSTRRYAAAGGEGEEVPVSSDLLADDARNSAATSAAAVPGVASARPLVICGPSGVGKGTIISKYMTERGGSDRFGFSVSHTTRRPRPGERDGVDYHFVSDVDSMRADIAGGKFVEHAEVHGNLYGTSLASIEDVRRSGKICLLDIDVQGVRSMKDHPEIEANFVFVAPPSMEVLRERLAGRGTETEESIDRRFRAAAEEVRYGTEGGNFDHVLVNDDIEEACDRLDGIVREMYDSDDS